MEQVELELHDDNGYLGEHARWDTGRTGWGSWRRKGWRSGPNSSEWRAEGWSDLDFAKAVESSPLLDDDAIVLRSAGGEVSSSCYATVIETVS